MRVLICGSRGWKDPTPIDTILAGCDVLSEGANEKLVVIQGGARGADTLAATLARGWRAQVITEEADWDRYGKGAGPVRNKKMLDDHKPDVVYAFRTYGKSNGTDDMVKQTRDRGIPCYVINGGDDAAPE